MVNTDLHDGIIDILAIGHAYRFAINALESIRQVRRATLLKGPQGEQEPIEGQHFSEIHRKAGLAPPATTSVEDTEGIDDGVVRIKRVALLISARELKIVF